MKRSTYVHLAVLPLFALLALGSASPKKKDGAGEKAAPTELTAGALGKSVEVGDAEWTILDVVNRGSTMKANESYLKDATTEGVFIQVHFRVKNKGKEEGSTGDIPKLVDASGREFGTVASPSAFRPKGTDGVLLNKINPTLSKEFTEVYELPPGITTLSLKAHDFGLFGKDKLINLGAIPAAPPDPVAPVAVTATSAAKPVAAAPAAAKAKASPAKAEKPVDKQSAKAEKK